MPGLPVFKKARPAAILLAGVLIAGVLLAACGDTSPAASPVSSTALATVAPTLAAVSTALALPSPSALAQASIAPTPQVEAGESARPAAQPTLTPVVSGIKPPAQPASGPGGSAYSYGGMISNNYGTGEEGYYIFEPDKPRPDNPLPLIVLLHGYEGINPNVGYRSWIEHLVRRGNIVVFPIYQERSSREGEKFTPNALAAIKGALERLKESGRTRPDLNQFILVGYSAGGIIATNLAARASQYGLPVPKALFGVTPGGCANCSVLSIRNFNLASAAELKAIPPATKLLLLAGDRDVVVGQTATNIIWQNTSQIPVDNKNYLLALTDNYGQPPLVADHGMVVHTPPNALNYNGIWKLLDGLQSCAIAGKDCDYALGNTARQRSLGQWSDGKPVIELKVLG